MKKLYYLLLNPTYLVDSFLKDRALVRLDRERAHVRDIGGNQLGQLLYVDVLLLSASLFIIALVSETNKQISNSCRFIRYLLLYHTYVLCMHGKDMKDLWVRGSCI